MHNQIMGQIWIEQPDGESHHHGDERRPYRRSHKDLLERMARGKVDDASTADDIGEDEDERDSGQQQGLRPLAAIAQGLGDDNGDEEVERSGQNLRSKSI